MVPRLALGEEYPPLLVIALDAAAAEVPDAERLAHGADGRVIALVQDPGVVRVIRGQHGQEGDPEHLDGFAGGDERGEKCDALGTRRLPVRLDPAADQPAEDLHRLAVPHYEGQPGEQRHVGRVNAAAEVPRQPTRTEPERREPDGQH
jgi:hypothetical protein